MSEVLRRVLEVVRAGERFLVMGHRRPDADALGSALGLAATLRRLGKEVTVFAPDELPDSVAFLVGSDSIARELSPGETYDATFVMDTAAPALVPESFPGPEARGRLVVIDHHRAFEDFGDITYRDAEACATAVLVLRIAEALGVEVAGDPSIAEPLYAAILADTGGFRYPGTRAETLRSGAKLVEGGVDPWRLAYHVFEDWPLERLRLLGVVLDTLSVELDGRLAILHVTRPMLEATGAHPTMVEGLVNYARMLRGVEVAALLWEWDPQPDASGAPASVTKISLRSAGHVQVSTIAIALGGGGHWAAAGANVPIDLESARQRVCELTRELLDS